jgi:hypothetical protein
MLQTIHAALDKVTTAANNYDEAVELAANAAANSATARENADSADSAAEEARQLEASELQALRDAVDELDLALQPATNAIPRRKRPAI